MFKFKNPNLLMYPPLFQAGKVKDEKKKPKSSKPAAISYEFDHPEGEKKNVSGF